MASLHYILLFYILSNFNAKCKYMDNLTVFDYHERFGIPLAQQIYETERFVNGSGSRIVGGEAVTEGQIPYQAGLVVQLVGVTYTSVCGASLVSANRLVTAAHCWYDGSSQASAVTVVLGSLKLYSGGTRVKTRQVYMHKKWNPQKLLNDIALIYLPERVEFTVNISPLDLPSGPELQVLFDGVRATASGYGQTKSPGSITSKQYLSKVSLQIMENTKCLKFFPYYVKHTHICTSGVDKMGTCFGDSGGPLVVQINGNIVLVGITSFGDASGCTMGSPSVYTRVTSYIDFIRGHMENDIYEPY